jgi:hypothetical protein
MVTLYIILKSIYKKYITFVVDRIRNPNPGALSQQKQGKHTQKKATQQPDDGKGTMMVHSRRRIGFHGHQAMESTKN